MSDKIKQLAEQALMSTMVHDQMYRPEGYAHAVSKQFADEFAELIVKECAKIADDGFGSDHFGSGIAGYQLLQHFGVEE